VTKGRILLLYLLILATTLLLAVEIGILLAMLAN